MTYIVKQGQVWRALTLADIEPNQQWIEQVDAKRKATERNNELCWEQLLDPRVFDKYQLVERDAAEQRVGQIQS